MLPTIRFYALLTIAIVSSSFLSKCWSATGDCIAIEFSSDGNKQCQEMHSVTDQAIRDGWVVRRIDLKKEPHVAARWQIQNVPTTIIVRNGRELDRVLGVVSYRELQQRLTAASSVDTVQNGAGRRQDSEPKVRGQSQLAMVPSRSNPIGDFSDSRSLSASISNAPNASKRDPRDATVRIRVQEAKQEGVGTGTIIDSYNGEALVLTCGHLFRDSQGQAPITIETFIGGQVQSHAGILIDYQAGDTDIGLVSFHPTAEVGVAKLIPKTRKLAVGQRVFSWGCDRGAPPSRNDAQISKLNRYLGAPNVEVDVLPVEGRSGGGLFDSHGELIGVCYAADPQLKEGLYNSAEVVYEQLAKLGLQKLFNEQKDEPESLRPTAGDRFASNAATSPITSVSDMTVTITRADGMKETLVIPQPSPQLLQALREQTRR